MQFYVEINYRKGPTFSAHVACNCAEIAKLEAANQAKRWGFNEKIKKIIVRRESHE